MVHRLIERNDKMNKKNVLKLNQELDDRLDGRSFKFLTRAEYEALSETEKNEIENNDNIIKHYITEGIFLVTTTKAIYVGDSNKTLDEAINDGSLGGTTATTSGRGYCITMLRGCEINVYAVPENASTMNTMAYTFPTGDSNRLRRMFVWTPSGGKKYIEIPDGTLALNDALVYNFDDNTLTVKNTSWGNVSVANNEIILLYNSYTGIVGGVLSQYIKYYNPVGDGIPVYDLEFDLIANRGTASQGMFIMGDYLYTWSHSSDDRTTSLGSYNKFALADLNTQVASGQHNLGHMNSPSYCSVRDMMMVGNGSKIYNQTNYPMAGYIYTNFSTVMESNPANLDHDSLDKITLDLSQFAGECKAQLCWGDPSTDYVYLMTCDNTIIRKLKLNKTDGRYDGTYTVTNTWRSTQTDINGGFKFYKGYLLSGVKGDYGIRKMELCTNGRIKETYIHPNNKSGDMQGLDVYDGYLYAYTDTKGYKISITDI